MHSSALKSRIPINNGIYLNLVLWADNNFIYITEAADLGTIVTKTVNMWLRTSGEQKPYLLMNIMNLTIRSFSAFIRFRPIKDPRRRALFDIVIGVSLKVKDG